LAQLRVDGPEQPEQPQAGDVARQVCRPRQPRQPKHGDPTAGHRKQRQQNDDGVNRVPQAAEEPQPGHRQPNRQLGCEEPQDGEIHLLKELLMPGNHQVGNQHHSVGDDDAGDQLLKPAMPTGHSRRHDWHPPHVAGSIPQVLTAPTTAPVAVIVAIQLVITEVQTIGVDVEVRSVDAVGRCGRCARGRRFLGSSASTRIALAHLHSGAVLDARATIGNATVYKV
jgi:hypothetical protein